ncbi:ATP-dependent RNA helicase dhx8 [Astathelohania contejeani]|uniref:ATP-dependent RNA helicase dhx8 n=1 Tax=Astathelohania contejeani TaxID=164912 RepID=A0ABQ7I2T1_9MICR|nr:ATP-dependent RNA helicase dhx8 [Thelohania contejeani]
MLAIENYKEKIISTIKKNKFTIISGPTGCGKSTLIPKYLYELKSPRIAIIEPRRIAVKALFTYLSRDIPNIGYKMRFDSYVTKETTVTVMTDGVFLNELLACRRREKLYLPYDYVIIDEVHERNIRTDIILGVFKANGFHLPFKVILMSATMQTEKLKSYFNASLFIIKGRQYKCIIKYEDRPVSDYITESYIKIKRILREQNNIQGKLQKDILVFLTGEEDINELYELLKRLPQVQPYKIYAALSDIQQKMIFSPTHLTKVILATNICEASLTIPGIKYVIDCGLYKTKIHSGINFLGIRPISKESADQRAGRCNRLGDGICYRLYTNTEYQMLGGAVPEIVKTDLSYLILFFSYFKIDIFTFEFLDYPKKDNAMKALKYLYRLGCIKITSVLEITDYGKVLLNNPLEINLSHFFEQCKKHNLRNAGAMAISLISQENYNFLESINSLNKENIENSQCDDFQDVLNNEEYNKNIKISDVEYLRELMEKFLHCKDEEKFCEKLNISYKGMRQAKMISKQLMDIENVNEDINRFEEVFSKSFEHNISQRQENGSYKHLSSGIEVWIHPTSKFFKRKDKFIVFVDAFCSTKKYARIVGKYYK